MLIAIIPSIFSFILGWFINKYHKMKQSIEDKQDERDAVLLSVKYMLKKSLMDDYKYWSDKGYLPLQDRTDIQNCYEIYHNILKGNGSGEYCYNELMKLPSKEGK